jgi:hypothetical protein
MLEQMTFPKEETGGSQDPVYNTAPEALVQCGQMSPTPQYLAISLSDKDSRHQDAPDAMPKIEGRTMTAESFWTVSHNKAAKI